MNDLRRLIADRPCLLLDFEVLDRRSFEAPANKDHSSYQILVVGIDEAFLDTALDDKRKEVRQAAQRIGR